jgi:glycosyltransferase involved in cell wall biosynthesis
MSAACDLSVVVPVYGNADTVGALRARVRAALDGAGIAHEMIFVDDASRDGSLRALQALAAPDDAVRVLALPRNGGQHRAVLAGLRLARGAHVAIMDADLQDPPEALPALLARARAEAGCDAVFAGRRGRYESRGRLLTSRAFKWLLHAATGLPADAGMYVVITRALADALAAEQPPAPFVVAMIGRLARGTCSLPVFRDRRPSGRSAYTGWDRLRIGAGALAVAVAGRIRSAAR